MKWSDIAEIRKLSNDTIVVVRFDGTTAEIYEREFLDLCQNEFDRKYRYEFIGLAKDMPGHGRKITDR